MLLLSYNYNLVAILPFQFTWLIWSRYFQENLALRHEVRREIEWLCTVVFVESRYEGRARTKYPSVRPCPTIADCNAQLTTEVVFIIEVLDQIRLERFNPWRNKTNLIMDLLIISVLGLAAWPLFCSFNYPLTAIHRECLILISSHRYPGSSISLLSTWMLQRLLTNKNLRPISHMATA